MTDDLTYKISLTADEMEIILVGLYKTMKNHGKKRIWWMTIGNLNDKLHEQAVYMKLRDKLCGLNRNEGKEDKNDR